MYNKRLFEYTWKSTSETNVESYHVFCVRMYVRLNFPYVRYVARGKFILYVFNSGWTKSMESSGPMKMQSFSEMTS